MLRNLLLTILCCKFFAVAAAPGADAAAPMSGPHLFMENRGQVHGADGKPAPQVLYHLPGKGLNVSLTAGSIHYTFFKALNKPADVLQDDSQPLEFETLGLDVTLEGAKPSPRITAEDLQSYYEHFYLPGSGPAGLTNVRSYARIVYHDVYPKIDWVVYVPQEGGGSGVKYDFVVHPGGDPAQIRLKYNGPSALSQQDDGGLLVQTGLGSVQEEKPFSYIRESGLQVASSYRLRGNELSFAVSPPAGGTLVIDPRVFWSTYFGGNNRDGAQNIGMLEGNIYICGETSSAANLATFGSHQSIYSGGSDAFLASFSNAGNLAWATYYGGSGLERCWAMAMDTASMYVYIAGQTVSSSGMATTGSYQTVYNGGATPFGNNPHDGFIAKFRANGTLVWGSYYGGGGADAVTTAACDAQGNLYVGGQANSSTGIATTGTHKPTHSFVVDSYDVFIAKFDTAGNRVWGTYFGGGNIDGLIGICTDRSGNVYATGYTYSQSGIATSGAHQTVKYDTTFPSMDAWLARFTSSGGLTWSSYYGGALDDYGQAVTCDSVGNVYLSGITSNQNGMSTTGAHQTSYGGGKNDGFIAKFSSAGVRRWSTYYGGAGYENIYLGMSTVPFGFYYYFFPKWSLCFTQGNLWLGGYTTSSSNMVTANAEKLTLSGSSVGDSVDAIIASFDSSGNRLYGTYFGGPGRDYGTALCGENGGGIYLAGMTESSSGIAGSGAFQPSLGGTSNGFLLRLSDSVAGLRIVGTTPYCTGATFTLNVIVSGGGTLLAGNIFRVQLSNATGSFSAPTVIGTRTSVGGGTISCTLPAGITGTGYRLRIVSTNPVMISDTAAIFINPLPQPVITYTSGTLSTGIYSSYQWYRNGAAIPGATTNTYKPTTNGQYTVRVTLTTGCTDISPVYTVTGLSVSNFQQQGGVKVYPNPAHDFLIIEAAVSGLHATLSNMLGQQVAEMVITDRRQEISLAALPVGVYILRLVYPNGGAESVRIIRQ